MVTSYPTNNTITLMFFFFFLIKAELRRNIGLLQAEVQKKDGTLGFILFIYYWEIIISLSVYVTLYSGGHVREEDAS